MTAGPTAWWYLNRATGMVALVLLTGSLVLGIIEQQRWRNREWPANVIHRLHRNVSLLVVVFLLIHIVASVVDGFAPIQLVDAVVPFVSEYRPIWLGLGALVLDLLIAITITSLLRKRIGRRAWRTVHWFTYAAWPIAVVHGLGTGTDIKQPWLLTLTGLCVLAVIAATWVRVVGSKLSEQARPAAYGALLIAPLAALVWLPNGPLGQSWASRAGTPASILGTGKPKSAVEQEAQFDSGFSVPINGTIERKDGGGSVHVQITMKLDGPPDGVAAIELDGRATSEGRTNFTRGQATLGPASKPTLYRGAVKSIDDGTLHAIVADPQGRSLNVTFALSVEGATVTGTAAAQPSATSES